MEVRVRKPKPQGVKCSDKADKGFGKGHGQQFRAIKNQNRFFEFFYRVHMSVFGA